MNINELIAIDVHTHAEVSCRQEPDEAWKPFEAASSKYFKAGKRPTIAETVAYYRERKIGLVMFTVDSEFEIGNRRIPNEEVADAARENADMMVAFASIDPHKGKMGVREARRLIKEGVITTGQAGFFDEHSVVIAQCARALADYGVEPRHLRAFRSAADRQSDLIAQIAGPLVKTDKAGARDRADDLAREVAALAITLHTALIKSAVRDVLDR